MSTDNDAHAAMQDNPQRTLDRVRRQRCPVDDSELEYAPLPDLDSPPLFRCTEGHGWWQTNGTHTAWFADLRKARELSLGWEQPKFGSIPVPHETGGGN